MCLHGARAGLKLVVCWHNVVICIASFRRTRGKSFWRTMTVLLQCYKLFPHNHQNIAQALSPITQPQHWINAHKQCVITIRTCMEHSSTWSKYYNRMTCCYTMVTKEQYYNKYYCCDMYQWSMCHCSSIKGVSIGRFHHPAIYSLNSYQL